jgi:hypothetical protein
MDSKVTKLTRPGERKLKCSNGHEFLSALPYALTLPDPYKLNSKHDWCLRCITELFTKNVGIVSEV